MVNASSRRLVRGKAFVGNGRRFFYGVMANASWRRFTPKASCRGWRDAFFYGVMIKRTRNIWKVPLQSMMCINLKPIIMNEEEKQRLEQKQPQSIKKRKCRFCSMALTIM